MVDRRQEERFTINHEFKNVDEFLREYAMNVSVNGVFVRTPDPLPVGTRVKLKFTIILEDFETIEGVGRVVRCVSPGGEQPPGMGVVFTSLSDRSQELLSRLFVRKWGKDDPGPSP